jgi:glycosyl transferase family 25
MGKKNILFTCYPVKRMERFQDTQLFDFIDKVVYINLEERSDRKESILEQLKSFPEDKIVRFNAIKESPGYIGCNKSHISVLEMAIDNNWKNVLIVEDDMIWKDFDKGYSTLKKLASKPYDVIVLGAPTPDYDLTTLKLNEAQTTTAYLVSNHYYQTLLKNFKESLFHLLETNVYHEYAIDQWWKKLQKTDNWYIVIPNLSIQKNDYSDIQGGNIIYGDW